MKIFIESYAAHKQWTFAVIPTVLINRDETLLTIAVVWFTFGIGLQFKLNKNKEQ